MDVLNIMCFGVCKWEVVKATDHLSVLNGLYLILSLFILYVLCEMLWMALQAYY